MRAQSQSTIPSLKQSILREYGPRMPEQTLKYLRQSEIITSQQYQNFQRKKFVLSFLDKMENDIEIYLTTGKELIPSSNMLNKIFMFSLGTGGYSSNPRLNYSGDFRKDEKVSSKNPFFYRGDFGQDRNEFHVFEVFKDVSHNYILIYKTTGSNMVFTRFLFDIHKPNKERIYREKVKEWTEKFEGMELVELFLVSKEDRTRTSKQAGGGFQQRKSVS